jgi:single-strand DNA-binding protein
MLNTITLIGRLAQSPADKMRYSPNGVAVLPFTLAVNRPPTAGGTSATDWIDCVTFQKRAENMANHLDKGALIAVEGRLQTRTYENQDGQKRKAIEVVTHRVTFLDRKSDASNQGPAPANEDDGWAELGTIVG